jgi:hypothetical protein
MNERPAVSAVAIGTASQEKWNFLHMSTHLKLEQILASSKVIQVLEDMTPATTK